METLHTEVLVIGSGFGAAAPALRLARSGFEVLMIEKGPEIVPARDFRQTQDPQYLLRYIKSVRGDNVNYIYAEGLGGGSGFYESVSLRAPTIAFDQRDGAGTLMWPGSLSRERMNPYYEIAERMMCVSQLDVHDIPRSGLAFARLMKRLGYSVDRVPYSVRGCVGHSFCVAGCTSGAKVTVHKPYLAPACRAGMRIITGLEARRVRILRHDEPADSRLIAEVPYRYEVQCYDAARGSSLEVKAKILILAGGTVGTARLLLNSRAALPALSGEVGKNISVNGTVKSLGILPEDSIEGDMFTGLSHPGLISYEFLSSRGITISTSKPLPVDAVSYANIVIEGERRIPSWWGEAKVDMMKLYRRRAIVLYALGLTNPTASLRLRRGGEVVPQFSMGDDFRAYYQQTLALLHSILRRGGARVAHIRIIDAQGVEYDDLHTTTAHMTGSCRMGEDPSRAVCDASGEVFHYKGMYVTDGSAIPSALAVNPYLTILANAERVGDLLKCTYHSGRSERGHAETVYERESGIVPGHRRNRLHRYIRRAGIAPPQSPGESPRKRTPAIRRQPDR